MNKELDSRKWKSSRRLAWCMKRFRDEKKLMTKPRDFRNLRTKKAFFFLGLYVKACFNDQCFICGSKKKLDAHHIMPKNDFPEYFLEVDNLVPLCKYHHYRTHGSYYKDGPNDDAGDFDIDRE